MAQEKGSLVIASSATSCGHTKGYVVEMRHINLLNDRGFDGVSITVVPLGLVFDVKLP